MRPWSTSPAPADRQARRGDARPTGPGGSRNPGGIRERETYQCRPLAGSGDTLSADRGGAARERKLENRNGVQARDLDPGEKGLVTGVGIEAQDIQSMTNQMARDMFASGFLNGLSKPPRVLIDEQEFRNEGSQIINRRMITQRLMTELDRASQGRMSFVGQRYAGMVAKQRELKREASPTWAPRA
jgi:hypothetical protein